MGVLEDYPEHRFVSSNCSRLAPSVRAVDLISAALVLVTFIFILAESVNHYQKTPPDAEDSHELASWVFLQTLFFIRGVAIFFVPAYIGYWMFDRFGFYVGWLVGLRLWWTQFDDGTD